MTARINGACEVAVAFYLAGEPTATAVSRPQSVCRYQLSALVYKSEHVLPRHNGLSRVQVYSRAPGTLYNRIQLLCKYGNRDDPYSIHLKRHHLTNSRTKPRRPRLEAKQRVMSATCLACCHGLVTRPSSPRIFFACQLLNREDSSSLGIDIDYDSVQTPGQACVGIVLSCELGLADLCRESKYGIVRCMVRPTPG